MRRYGIRPFRTSPYVYYSPKIGHWGYRNLPILILDNRISYKVLDGARARSSIVMPLAERCYLSGSFTADLFRDSEIAVKPYASVRLEQTFGKKKRSKALYAGFKYNEQSTFVFAGFFAPW